MKIQGINLEILDSLSIYLTVKVKVKNFDLYYF